MPKIAELPDFEGELTGTELMIVEDAEGTKVAPVSVMATRAQLLSVTPTSGNQLSVSSSVYDYLNGAVPIIRSGRRVGWTVPVGATAIGSYVVAFIPLHYQTVRLLKGCTVRIRTIVKASAGYLDAIAFGGNAVQVRRRDGTLSTNEGEQLGTPYQVGEQLVRDFAYVMQGDEVAFGATMQVGPGHAALTSEASFEIVSIAWDVIVAVPLEGAPVGVDLALDARASQMAPSVDIFAGIEGVEDAAYLKNGATLLRDGRDRGIGLSLAIGATGLDSTVQWRWGLNGRKRTLLAGAQLMLVLGFTTSNWWNRAHSLNMQARTLGLAPVEIVTSNVFDAQLSQNRRVMAFTFAMPAGVDLDDLRPFLRLAGADAATAAESLILTDATLQIVRTASDIGKAAEQTGALADESARADAVRQAAATIAGTGARVGRRLKLASFASIAAALMQATILAAPGDMAAVILPEGSYAENSLGKLLTGTDGDNVLLRGTGIGRTNIIARLPANSDQATIRATSTLDFNGTQDIEDLTAILRNGRYAVHIDAVKFRPDSRLTYRNVEAIHEGNDEADAYHGVSVWPSQHGFAIGTCSGSHYLFEGCRGMAPRAAFSAHNQTDFADPSKVELVNGRYVATRDGGWAVRLESIGSRVMDRCIIRCNTLSGEISLAVTPWSPVTLADQPADRREWEIVGYGNSPAAFRPESWSRALRIVSAATGVNSKVEIGGTAQLILFTRPAIQRAGDIGLSGDAYSWGCIQDQVGVGPNRDQFITGLGKRLGNRTAAPVTLTVRLNGGSAISILFNQDFTLWTNAQVLAFINAALGGAAVASEYDVEGLYRPLLMDEEEALRNDAGTTIHKGMALARDISGARTVRPMTAQDDYGLFAGIAWETIRPGAYGRVKTRGWLPLLDVLRTGDAVLSTGESFGIDPAKPGYLVSGRLDGTGLLRVVRPSLGAGLTTLEVAPGINAAARLPIVQGARMPVTHGAMPVQTDETGLASLVMTPEGLDGHFARPGSQRVPVTQGRRAVMIDQDGAAPIAFDENGRMILGPLAAEPVARMPVTGGILPSHQTGDGEVLRGDYDGVPYDPGAVARSIADPDGEVALGRKQAAVYDVAPGTMMPTRRVISLSQQGDLTPLEVVAPGILRVKGPDPLYPIGVVTWRPLSTTALTQPFLDIIGKLGQSNGLGIDADALGNAPNPKFTLQAPLPGICMTFNGGPHPHQSAGGSGDAATPITADRYTSLIDMVVGEREGQGLGAAEAYAMAMGPAARVLLINQCFSGTSFDNLVGASAGADAQPWTDFRTMISAAASLAAALGMTPRVRGIIWNHGENNDADTVAQYAGRLDILRVKADALKDLTGQSDPIPIILCQPASTKDLNSGLPQPAALAMSNWAAIPANNAVAMPLYWGSCNDVPTVHHLAQSHRHFDELAGQLIWQMATYGRARWPRMLSARRVGRKVTVIMSEPITIDTDGVLDPGNYGISYRDSTASRAVSGVRVDGNVITFLVAAPTGVGEVASIGCIGAKVYSEVATSTPNRNGMGRQYGLRSCLRSLRFHGSHTTGRPLFLWAQQQEIPVTVSA